jgi:RimJ/RimL family protein N-acetyltransferase
MAAMYPITRAGKRLSLRELQPEDIYAVFDIYGDPVATEHLSFEPRSLDEVGQIIDRSIASASAEPRSEYALAVVNSRDGNLIGSARLALDPHQPGGATIGFALRSDQWGKGFGEETVYMLQALRVRLELLRRRARIWSNSGYEMCVQTECGPSAGAWRRTMPAACARVAGRDGQPWAPTGT